MDTYDFRVGCDLNYNVNGPSAFIFNVSVVNNSFQRILTEAFMTEPQLQIEESRSPAAALPDRYSCCANETCFSFCTRCLDVQRVRFRNDAGSPGACKGNQA